MSTSFIKYLSKAALTISCFFILSCENKDEDVAAVTRKKIGVEEAKDVESFFSQGGIVKAKLNAPLMYRYQLDTPMVIFPESLFVDFYDENKVIESSLFASYGKYFENQNQVMLSDSVKVYNNKGDTLYCKELLWDQTQKKFTTDKPVRIHTPDKIIYGKGLEAAENFSWYTILNPKGILDVSSDPLAN